MPFDPKSVVEQVTEHLRTALHEGRWQGLLPGRERLAGELGVNAKTVEAALRQLEREGVLKNPGKGRRRQIVTEGNRSVAPLRIALLLSEKDDARVDFIVDIRQQLLLSGHDAFHAEQSLGDLAMNPDRISGLVSRTTADAWIVVAGSREVLEWFAAGPIPAFALFGPMSGVRMAGAGPRKAPAIAEAARTLLALGHRRIAMLVRPRRRAPVPGVPERAFLDELRAHGIPPAAYHLPDWDESPERFHAMLESIFRVTPPTALIVDESALFVAVMQFCLDRRLRVPEDLSLVCTDADPVFSWCRRSVAHIDWNRGPVLRRVFQWADQLSRGKTDLRQNGSVARFVPGETIGRVPRRDR
jgi:DNA-binding LacI/PurR family transcriptional regulator/DNA-binding transcriptional regulator YhcF (GntR family)